MRSIVLQRNGFVKKLFRAVVERKWIQFLEFLSAPHNKLVI